MVRGTRWQFYVPCCVVSYGRRPMVNVLIRWSEDDTRSPCPTWRVNVVRKKRRVLESVLENNPQSSSYNREINRSIDCPLYPISCFSLRCDSPGSCCSWWKRVLGRMGKQTACNRDTTLKLIDKSLYIIQRPMRRRQQDKMVLQTGQGYRGKGKTVSITVLTDTPSR